MLLKLRYNPDSNPTLSANLVKIKELHVVNYPLSGSFFFFGMTDMQFCKARVRSVKAKTDLLGISSSIGERGVLQTQVGVSASAGAEQKTTTERRADCDP